MIELYINNRPVELPMDFSFTFLYENPYFTDCSNSSYDITLPLEGSSRNLRIFGPINRMEVWKPSSELPAELVEDGIIRLRGSAIINEIDNKMVKIQLVSGNSEMNFRFNKSVLINELDLGSYPFPLPMDIYTNENDVKMILGSVDDTEVIFMPVASKDKENNGYKFCNRIRYDYPTKAPTFVNPQEITPKAPQPYLLTVLKKITEAMGYTIQKNAIKDSWEFCNMYIVSTIESEELKDLLPDWTVAEFYDQVEALFSVMVLVNEDNKTVDIIKRKDFFSNNDFIIIEDDNVIEEYEAKFSDESSSKSSGSANFAYQLGGSASNNFYRVDKNLITPDMYTNVTDKGDMQRRWIAMTQAEALKTVFNIPSTGQKYINYRVGDKNVLWEIDTFRDLRRDDKDKEDFKLKIVPAPMIIQDVMFYKSLPWPNSPIHPNSIKPEVKYYVPVMVPESSVITGKPEEKAIDNIQEALENGNKPVQKKKLDIIEVAINDPFGTVVRCKGEDFKVFAPFTDSDQYSPEALQRSRTNSSLALDNRAGSVGAGIQSIPRINTHLEYIIKFRSDDKIDVRKVFIIRGQKYVCQKIETEVSYEKFTHIYEGTFYKLTV